MRRLAFWRSESLLGEITRWTAIVFALGLVVVGVTAWIAERSAARNLADFAMIDFFQEELQPALSTCAPDDRFCLGQQYRNETGGIWRFTDAAGREHRSFSFDLSPFGVAGSGVASCARSERRTVGGYALFTCAPSEGGIDYRIAQRGPGAPGGADDGALIALELPAWSRKVDRAVDHFLIWRSLRVALIAMAATLGVVLGLALLLLRTRLRRHFTRLSAEIDAYRSGAQPGVLGAYPREIQELASSLNRAIEKNDGLIRRQRRNVNKMAHDLRHQLVNLDVAARSDDQAGLGAEITRVGQLVERYLTLVDWVGPAEGQPRIHLAKALEEARRSFSRRLREAPLEIAVDCPDALTLRLHPTDLNIILSNLVSNAHKHAAGRIRLAAENSQDAVTLIVEDDGPGIPAEQRDKALGWGERLDHALPGSGFGLAIVAEQVRELYQGAARLSESPLGGLRVEITLPRPSY